MGEFSKRIGEIGEEIVEDFLNLIGWKDPMLNFDIPSVNPEKHQKKTNGIDGFFHYRSPMISRTIENSIISVKFSKNPYASVPSTFKKYYEDLAMAIESFKLSEIRSNTLNRLSDIESTFDRGVLFWINNIIEDKKDIPTELLNIILPKGYIHDGIILVDNVRMAFIFDSLYYVRSKFQNCNIEFSYFVTGLNNDDQISKNGMILPVQYLSSSILPLRVHNKSTQEITLVLCSKNKFSEEGLLKLMGLAKNIGTNMQASTLIAYPNYNKQKHEQVVQQIKQSFEDLTFTSNLSVTNYNTSYLG